MTSSEFVVTSRLTMLFVTLLCALTWKQQVDGHPAQDKDGSRDPGNIGHFPRDCHDLQQLGYRESRMYTVYVGYTEVPLEVYCDMDSNSGGWLVFQRRFNGSVSFHRTWSEYEVGFGHMDGGEFWLGNIALNLLTSARTYELQIRLMDHDSWEVYAQYQSFSVGTSSAKYIIAVSGYSGTAGDSLESSYSFSTYDRENAAYCSKCCGGNGGFWYGRSSCSSASYYNSVLSSLNGNYTVEGFTNARTSNDYRTGIYWKTFRGYYYSLKQVQMAIRPAP